MRVCNINELFSDAYLELSKITEEKTAPNNDIIDTLFEDAINELMMADLLEEPEIPYMDKNDVLYTGVCTEKNKNSNKPEHVTLNFKGAKPSRKQLGRKVTVKTIASGEYRNPETGKVENTGELVDDKDLYKKNPDLKNITQAGQKLHITTGVHNGGKAKNTSKANFNTPISKTREGRVAVFDNKGNWSYTIKDNDK